MYELFYNFLIEELLVRYFKQTEIEVADKFYVVIEDATLRQEFYKALAASEYTEPYSLYFSGYEKYGKHFKPYDTVVFNCAKSGVKILVSGCDDANDGFQTKIRNSIGNSGNPLSDMATLFVLQGTNAIETLLSSGHNLQEYPYPFCIGSITKAVKAKISTTINVIERNYLQHYVNKISFQDDYASLFDFAPVLSILQKGTIRESFNELGAFKDSEIYENMFAAADVKTRVEDNTSAYGIISDMIGEVYEEDQYRKLCTYLDSKLAKRIVKGTVNWKSLDYKQILTSHLDCIANAVLRQPTIKLSGATNAEIIVNTKGSDKKSKSYVLICSKMEDTPQIKAVFNKDLKDYHHKGDASISGRNMVFAMGEGLMKDRIGDDKNYHEVIALKLRTANIFGDIEHYFKIDAKGNIVVDVPDSMESATIGIGTTEVKYDKLSPVLLDENTCFRVEFNHDSIDEPLIPFQFGDKIINIYFRYKGDKTITQAPATIVDTIWGAENGSFKHEGEDGDIAGTIIGPQGPLYVHERFRKLLNYEKYMVDSGVNHIVVEDNEFGGEQKICANSVNVDSSIVKSLEGIYDFFREKATLPSLTRPNEELTHLYSCYLTAVHNQIANIPSDRGLSNENKNIAKLGVVELCDGSILLSPFHPLMVAYALQLNKSIDNGEYKKRILRELSPLYLMPFIYYDKSILKAINSTETEDLLTWVMYDNATKAQQMYGSKSTAELVTDKIKNFISNFKLLVSDKKLS